MNNEWLRGALEDSRPQEKKDLDFSHKERSLGALDAFNNPRITKSEYPATDQKMVGSCVIHATTLAYGIEKKLDRGQFTNLSKVFPYRLRSTHPRPGTIPVEGFELLRKRGSPLYSTAPNPTTEAEVSAYYPNQPQISEAEINKGGDYYVIPDYWNIDTIASVAQRGHGVPLCIFADYDEWKLAEPKILFPNLTKVGAEVSHEVCVLPFSGHLVDGKRFVTIQDSSPFGGISIRHVSEEFIKARAFFAGYWDNTKVLGGGERPRYVFSKALTINSNGPEVVALQKLLIAEELLPADCSTGFFGGRTLAAVRAFQDKYAADILNPIGLKAPTNTWGPMCIKKANLLCK